MSKMSEAYRVDAKMESEAGVRCEFLGPCWVTLRRAGGNNKQYQRIVQDLTKPVRRKIANETISIQELDEIYMKAYARAVVVGWEDVTDLDDNPVPFTEANFIRVMQMYPDFWDDIQREAARMTNFRKDQNKLDGEDLGNSLSGTSSGATH